MATPRTVEDLKKAQKRAHELPTIKKDSHGCIIGREVWDTKQQKCVPDSQASIRTKRW